MNSVDQYVIQLLGIFLLFLGIIIIPVRIYFKQQRVYNEAEKEYFDKKELEVSKTFEEYTSKLKNASPLKTTHNNNTTGPDHYNYLDDGESRITCRGEILYNMIRDSMGTGERAQ